MKSTILCPLFALVARQVTASRYPELQWDPETAEDCIEWYNNGDDQSCEYVRDYFGVTPEQFRQWNPSLGLDCKPWRRQSYCIVTQDRLDNTPKPSISSTVSMTMTSALSLIPSPTAWTDKGCFVEDPKLPILDQNMSPNGDAALSVSECKNSCYRHGYEFAGVQEGNQCWCGTYIGGQLAENQTDCKVPCSGDKTTKCGGKGLLRIFQAEKNKSPSSTTSAGNSPTVKVVSVSKTAGAKRSNVMFWKN